MSAQFISMDSWSKSNIYGFGVYKNKTKNKVWDMALSGKLFFTGYHAGDYNASAYLSKMLTSKGTYLKLGFINNNRTPSTNFMGITSFPIHGINSIKKENILQLNGVMENVNAQWKLALDYQLIHNFQYFSTGYQANVYGNAISYLKGQFQNKFKLSTYWNWYNEIQLQVVDPNAPIHVPLLLTRQRLAFEGVFYKNLNMSTGLELIYHTAFKADGYMPLTGQFYTQNEYSLTNRPTSNAFLHIMIKRLKAYIRLENLNTLLGSSASTGNHYNFYAKNYPGTGTWIRVGIWWNFIN